MLKRGQRVWLVERSQLNVMEGEVSYCDPPNDDHRAVTVNIRPGCSSKFLISVPRDRVYLSAEKAEAYKAELRKEARRRR